MTEFRGRLYIFVDPIRATSTDAPTAASADDIFGQRAPGEMLWYLNGWAVGKNSRGTYCARTSATKLRSFETFAAAMDFVRKKRKIRPQEQFHLVYDLDGRKSIVTTLEQIQRVDNPAQDAHGNTGSAAEQPVLESLAAKVGKIVAANALVLLQILTEHGEDAARERFSNATYTRLWQVLQEAELVGDGVAQ